MSSVIGQLNCDSFIRDSVREGFTHAAIASQLQHSHPEVSSGLSARSVRRYCSVNDIHYSSRLSEGQLDGVVEQAVFRVIFLCIMITSLFCYFFLRLGPRMDAALQMVCLQPMES